MMLRLNTMLRLVLVLLAALFAVQAEGQPALDVEEFWREQQDVPLDITVLQEGQYPGIKWQALVYTSEIYQDQPMRVFAFYVRPAREGRYPAVVSIHGGGGGADWRRAEEFARAGYACLSYDWNTFMDPPAQWKKGDPLPSKFYTVFGNLRYDDIGKLEDWGRQFFQPGADWKAPIIYRAAMAARRALTLLERRPEVDPQRLAVEGHSWGGFMAQLLAGIDPRVKAVVSSAAAGGWESRYRQGLAMHLQELTEPQMLEWTRRYDPASFAPRMTAPLLVLTAASDFFASIDTLAEYWPHIKAPKNLHLLAAGTHTFGAGVHVRRAWFDWWLKTGAAFPTVESVQLEPGQEGLWKVSTTVRGPVPAEAASVAWTTARGAWNSRFWAQRELKRDGDTWTTTFKPVNAGGPLRVFVSVRDTGKHVVSSMPLVQALEPPRSAPPKTIWSAPVRIARTAAAPEGKPDWTRSRTLSPVALAPELVGEHGADVDTLWNEQALYLKVRVDDHTPWRYPGRGVDFWVADSVQFRFRVDAAGADKPEVLHLSFFPQADRSVGINALRRRDLSYWEREVTPVKASVVTSDKGYTVEARVPWKFISSAVRPRPGSTFGVAMLINAGDILTNEWIGGVDLNRAADHLNPASWGTATLLP